MDSRFSQSGFVTGSCLFVMEESVFADCVFTIFLVWRWFSTSLRRECKKKAAALA